MLRDLPDGLCKYFHSLSAIRHAARYPDECMPDPEDRRASQQTGVVIEGCLTVSSYLILSTLLPFMERSVKLDIMIVGHVMMAFGTVCGIRHLIDLHESGRAALEKHAPPKP